MPQTMTKSSCACSTSGTASATEVIPGLANADLSKITLQQGVPWTWRQCFVKSVTPVQILEERIGGLLVVNKADHCFVAGSVLRLINYAPCFSDTDDSKSVFTIASIAPDAVDPTRDVLTVTGLTTIARIYQAVSATATLSPIGCASTVVAAASQPPYLMEVCDGAPLLITGGITTRDDYREYFAVSAAAGSNLLYSTILGKVQPGDRIESQALGLNLPSQVLRVDLETVQNTASGAKIQRERITIADKTTIASDCAAVEVRRGVIPLQVVSDGGRCWELTIAGASTAGMQLAKSARAGDSYKLGTLTVVAVFGTLVANKLRHRAVEILRSDVELKPSHMGVI